MVKYQKLKWNKENVWLTSDLHGFHRNICRGVSTWENKFTRDFDNEVEMTEHIVEKINKHVKPNDLLIHNGDWSFGGKDKIFVLRGMIDCLNIIGCYGNHDHHIINDQAAKDLFLTIDHVHYLQFENVRIFLSHYAHLVWHQSHQGVLHVYGHSHSTIEHLTNGKCMDVGIDNAYKIFGEYRPFNLLEVEKLLSDKELFLPDHHNQNTN